MWRRVYLCLVLVRVYFALSPSYIHPDEHFQGPEVVAGDVFNWRTTKTWEFTAEAPIRSIFPLWPVYGLPMQIMGWIMPGKDAPSPVLIFYTLRTLFFLVSFVLGRLALSACTALEAQDLELAERVGKSFKRNKPRGKRNIIKVEDCENVKVKEKLELEHDADTTREDWALQELVASPRQRRISLLLLASSYVTWTYQTHTFSNSVETIVVAWSLVLIGRIIKSKETAWLSSALLGITAVFGVFNRITFPAFILLPGLRAIPHFLKHPGSILTLLLFSALTSLAAIYLDTVFYASPERPAWSIFSPLDPKPIITPLNNLLYNSDPANLSLHGLHAKYTHILINLPQLLGPAMISLLAATTTLRFSFSLPVLSSISGITILSLFAHQEARFIIPAVPLLLCSISLPRNAVLKRLWVVSWIIFNAVYGLFMGVYHQGGIVPAQSYLSGTATDAGNVVWWKTYPPPTWLLGARNEQINTTSLMGASFAELMGVLEPLARCSGGGGVGAVTTYLVAPLSAVQLDGLGEASSAGNRFWIDKTWTWTKHLNMDDLEFGEDGVVGTISRVVGRRGLGVWKVWREDCGGKGAEGAPGGMLKDW